MENILQQQTTVLEYIHAEQAKIERALAREVEKLREQIKKANDVIIRLVEDSRKTTDYDTLTQHSHLYDRRTD